MRTMSLGIRRNLARSLAGFPRHETIFASFRLSRPAADTMFAGTMFAGTSGMPECRNDGMTECRNRLNFLPSGWFGFHMVTVLTSFQAECWMPVQLHKPTCRRIYTYGLYKCLRVLRCGPWVGALGFLEVAAAA